MEISIDEYLKVKIKRFKRLKAGALICVEFLGYIFHATMPAFAVRHRRCLSAVPEYR